MNTALVEKRLETPAESPFEENDPEEQHLLIRNVTWQQYQTLRDMFDDRPGLRMFYLKGMLEIMSPSNKHELCKKMIARLLEMYAVERSIALNGHGSTTFRVEAAERGLEPDECYVIGEFHEVPDIALQVVVSRGQIDKLEIYQGLEVPEVWFFQRGKFSIFHLREHGYERIERSEFLPDLDLDVLLSFVNWQDQTQAVRTYQQALRQSQG